MTSPKIKINRELLKTIALTSIIMLVLGFTLGVHYENNQTKTINDAVRLQLAAVKK
jgi:hypothetical protein